MSKEVDKGRCWLLSAVDFCDTVSILNELWEEDSTVRLLSVERCDTLWGELLSFLIELPSGGFRTIYAEMSPRIKWLVDYFSQGGVPIYVRVPVKMNTVFEEGDEWDFFRWHSKDSERKEV